MRPDLPPGRYDPPSRRDRVVTYALAGSLAVGGVLGAYTLYSRHQAGRMDAELTEYVVTSDSSVRITFQVVPRGHEGECKVRAKDRTGQETGSKLVTVHPTTKRTQLVTVDVPTSKRPVNGELVACRRL